VRSGESIWLIARRNGVGVDALKRANRLTTSRIVPGQLLRIPGAR
jgi:LysM repeat protein